tara:strand:- start:774 stop:1271 length:498 start_codon:yes stop_codon:yes gene_type:complete
MQLLKSNIKRKISRKSKKSRKNKRNVIKTRKTRNSLKSLKNKVLRDINKNLKFKMKGGAIGDGSGFNTIGTIKLLIANINDDGPDYPKFSQDANIPDDFFDDLTSISPDLGIAGPITTYKTKVNSLNKLLNKLYTKYNKQIEDATKTALKISGVSTIISKVPMDP